MDGGGSMETVGVQGKGGSLTVKGRVRGGVQGGLMGLLQDSHSRIPNPVLSNSNCNIEYNKPNLKLKLMLVLHLIFV